MKTQHETLSLLSQYRPKSELDGEFIEAFLSKRFQMPPKSPVFSTEASLPTIDVQSFIQWFESGVGCLKIAKHKTSLVMTGRVTLEDAQIICKLENGNIEPADTALPQSELSEPTPDERSAFSQALYNLRLQPSPDFTLAPKYIPDSNDRVVFYTIDHSVEGVGIVRGVDEETGKVELYCYYTYAPKKLGYSMHERDVVNLQDFIFEPAGEQTPRSALGNTVSCLRRLQRELESVGKVWKDRAHRLEPLDFKPEKGSRYWYIDDKLRVNQTTDEGTPTARLRFLSGNYFTDHHYASVMLGKISDLLKDYLASPQWPEIEGYPNPNNKPNMPKK